MTKFMTANRGMEIRLASLREVPFAMLVSLTVPLPLGTIAMNLERYETGGR